MLEFLGKNFDFEELTVKVPLGGFYYPVQVKKVGGRIEFRYPFNKAMNTEIKNSFEGVKYHGFDEPNPRKIWSAKVTVHNMFRIAYYAGINPYSRYDAPQVDFTPNRKDLMSHQANFVKEILTRRFKIIAGEMGTGKTLACIEAMEASGVSNWLWVGPAAALSSVKLEFMKWKAKVIPTFVSYSSLLRWVNEYPEGVPPPCVVFDESQKL